MPKYRVYELAKMFGKTNEEVIDILKKNQYEVTRAVNSVDEKAKEILDRELAAKKPAKKPAFRTVRFDSKGRPQDGRKTQGQGGFSASYSTDGAEQEARAAAMKKAAPQKQEARPAAKPEGHPVRETGKTAVRSSVRAETEADSARTARQAVRTVRETGETAVRSRPLRRTARNRRRLPLRLRRPPRNSAARRSPRRRAKKTMNAAEGRKKAPP